MEGTGQAYVFTKGVPEYLIPSVTHLIDRSGNTTKITPHYVKQIEQIVS